MTAGIQADGSFVTKTFDDIEQGFVAAQRANIDTNIDTSQYSVIGQLNGIMATALAELWEAALDLHDSIDPDKAVGAQQDALYSLTGTLRREAKRSSVVATVTLAAGTNIATGDAQASVLGNSSAKFANAEPMVNATGSTATFEVTFRSLATGAVVANAGTLTVIDTVRPGWSAITNVLDADLGQGVESNAAFRRRRVEELAAQGGGTMPGLRADLLRIGTVRAATVVENTSSLTVAGMPPKSVEAIIRSDAGADDEDVLAATIWENKAAGIETIGTELRSVTDDEGVPHDVRFSRPTEQPIYVVLRLLKDPKKYVSDAATKLAIVAAAEDPSSVGYLDVGADVYAGRFVAAAMELDGVINADARLSLTPGTFDAGSTSVVISQREIATLDTSRISIGAFP